MSLRRRRAGVAPWIGRDDVPFTITWPRTMGLPSVTRDFDSSWDRRSARAIRIHRGIHFQFESDASQATCVKVPEFTDASYMFSAATDNLS